MDDRVAYALYVPAKYEAETAGNRRKFQMRARPCHEDDAWRQSI